MGSSVEELLDSNRFETQITKTQHILVFSFTCIDPWLASANQTDILKILICEQEFSAYLTQYTNSEGCLELLK
jgi:hypothetical protein